MRGEKMSEQDLAELDLGSPPRARGKVCGRCAAQGERGITPACAGKRSAAGREYRACRDHPRVRGEKSRLVKTACVRLGSPPRARGKVITTKSGTVRLGITPACAGKSTENGTSLKAAGDHPRVRGEKSTRHSARRQGFRSPPRARGKVNKRGKWQRYNGITPACAGKSLV